MIDQIRLDTEVPRQHVRDEPIRERRLVVEQPEHRAFLNDEDGGRPRRGGGPEPDRLTGQRAFPEEVAGSQHRHDRFFTGAR